MTKPDIHHLIKSGMEHKNAGLLEQARDIFQRVIDEGSHAASGYYHLALVAVDENKITEAIENYRQAILRNGKYYKAYNNLGLLYAGLQRYELALQCLKKAHDLAPEDHEPIVNLADTNYQLRKFDIALNYYEKVNLSALSPETKLQVEVSTGDCYLQTGNFDKAIETYSEVIKQNAQHVVALNQLGFIYLEVKRDFRLAEIMIDRGLAENPRFAPSLQNKGLIYKALGKYDEAVQYLQRKLEVLPGDFEAYYNIPCVYSAANNEEQVKTNLEQALKYAPFIKEHIRQDPDFARYREKSWFKNMV